MNGALRLSDSYRGDHSQSEQALDETGDSRRGPMKENARLSSPRDSGTILRAFTEVMIGRRENRDSRDRTIAGGVRPCKILALNGGVRGVYPTMRVQIMRMMQKKGSIEQGMEGYLFILAPAHQQIGKMSSEILMTMPLLAFPVDQGSRVQCRASLSLSP